MSWRRAQTKVEKVLHEFLGLDDGACVIYMNRAASAITAALASFNPYLHDVWVERPTFHAAPNIVERLEFREADLDEGAPDIRIPVALGGEAIMESYFLEEQVLYDCAQTCYQNMFKGIKFGPGHYAVLSFQESKPYGSPTGGGALVCDRDNEEWIREQFVPGTYYFNPRTGQCEETLGSLRRRDHAAVAEKYMARFCYEEARLAFMLGVSVINGRKSFKHPNLFTHVYVFTPKVEEVKNALIQDGYRFYADNELMRKELV